MTKLSSGIQCKYTHCKFILYAHQTYKEKYKLSKRIPTLKKNDELEEKSRQRRECRVKLDPMIK